MIISASILAIDDKDIYPSLESAINRYDLVHVDIGDNTFCPTYGIPFNVLKELSDQNKFLLDVHCMIENPITSLPKIKNLNIFSLSVHCEAINLDDFISMNNSKYKLGIGILPDTDFSMLGEYLKVADFVLLLCVKPGFSYQKPLVNPVSRVKEFQKIYPDYDGLITVDGGVSNKMLQELKELDVDIAVQGGAIFGSK